MITDSIVRAETITSWLGEAEQQIKANSDYLTQLDAAIGDADHGINLSRGFTAVLGALDSAAPTPGAILTLTGNTLISKVGGASGPLYGMAFRRAGKALGGAADVDLPALSAALEAALAGVQQLGAAREGDKTMVDALAVATRAFSKAIAEGASQDDALSVLAEAASAASRTATMASAPSLIASSTGLTRAESAAISAPMSTMPASRSRPRERSCLASSARSCATAAKAIRTSSAPAPAAAPPAAPRASPR